METLTARHLTYTHDVMDIPLPVGHSRVQDAPLQRFLPPVDEGVIDCILREYGLPDGPFLDPFGASPRVALEAARAGAAILVVANNPINRFVLERTLQPLRKDELRSALAHLGAMPKDGTRMERFLLDLYASHCARCGERVSVDYFVWDRDLGGPSHKVYTCDRCAYAGEAAATDADWERALNYSRRGLHHAMALEQVAPAGDPDRRHAEAALSVYPGRALYALTTLLNKVAQLRIEPGLRPAIDALLLSALDAANALWSYPEGRARPRLLSASPRFREHNVWRAMERAVASWALEDPEVELLDWEEDQRLEPGGVTLYAGSLRRLREALGDSRLPAILTVPPRPNQAYWTLSALWTAWLWGRETAVNVKVALRRRRYDWAWHAGALRTVLQNASPLVEAGAPAAAYLPEAEPGFVAAALLGFGGAGFKICGRALRAHEKQGFILWELSEDQPRTASDARMKADMREAAISVLHARNEPTPYGMLHASIWFMLAERGWLAPAWETLGKATLQTIGERVADVVGDEKVFVRLGGGADPESGLYWLCAPPDQGESLSDRVEKLVVATLREQETIRVDALDRIACRELLGLLTPDQRFLRACLSSYAEGPDPEGKWRLRDEDRPEARSRDCAEMRSLLTELGHSLGWEVEGENPLLWVDGQGEVRFGFRILETSVWGPSPWDADSRVLWVLPGGRAGLIAEKARRDPRLRDWLESGVRVVKFRHVRRLAAERGLTREQLPSRLAIDPPERQDPQLPLL